MMFITQANYNAMVHPYGYLRFFCTTALFSLTCLFKTAHCFNGSMSKQPLDLTRGASKQTAVWHNYLIAVYYWHGSSCRSWSSPLILAGLNGLKGMAQLLIRRHVLGLILSHGKTISAMRSSLAEIYFLLKSFEDSDLPLELRLKIFDEAFKPELICLLLDARRCHLLPVQTGKYLKMLREELPVILSDEKNCPVIARSLN